MKETDAKKILSISCATQLATFVILSLVQASLGYSFCFENQQCIVDSVKLLVMTLFLSILAGWISSGTHVVDIGSDATFTISKQKVRLYFGKFHGLIIIKWLKAMQHCVIRESQQGRCTSKSGAGKF